MAQPEKFDLVRAFQDYYQGDQSPPMSTLPQREPNEADIVVAMAHLMKDKLPEVIPDPEQKFLTTQRQMPANHPAIMARLTALRAKPGDPCLFTSLQLMDASGEYAVLNMGFVDAKNGNHGPVWHYGTSFGRSMSDKIDTRHIETALAYLLDPDYNYSSTEIDGHAGTNDPTYILRYWLAANELFTEKYSGRATLYVPSADTLNPDFGWLVSTVRDTVDGHPVCYAANAVVGKYMTDGVWMVHRGEDPGRETVEQALGLSVSSDLFNPDAFVRALEVASG